MRLRADLHIHSQYSRATSPRMNLESLAHWARIKGINVLGTGDFTHPRWMASIKTILKPAEQGFFKIKNNKEDNLRFVLTSEISCIYSKKSKVRKVHILVLAPSIDIAEAINKRLSLVGNISSDGRPILGLDAQELTKIILNISEKCLVIPAHVMTPWFAVFGSKSGFDSLEECFGNYSRYIYALETGLSANPEMLWRIPDGSRLSLISNSDAHSPENIGREANVFNTDFHYNALIGAIRNRNKDNFLYTIEFFPQEGKYHYDGHRDCQVSLSPKESKQYNNICPNCGKPLTIGVLNRIEQLAEKPEGFRPEQAPPFKSIVPLKEIISEVLGVGKSSKAVSREYNILIERLGSELDILLDKPEREIRNNTLPEIAEGIKRVRAGQLFVQPGYDGVYGRVKIFSQQEKKSLSKQGVLFKL